MFRAAASSPLRYRRFMRRDPWAGATRIALPPSQLCEPQKVHHLHLPAAALGRPESLCPLPRCQVAGGQRQVLSDQGSTPPNSQVAAAFASARARYCELQAAAEHVGNARSVRS
ncbi:unnamed protein product [Polarella glacialis]|uniref:Uncharacterized protein n=1 Tax=Polarella glacialis TaxID=89957 RepID=A0A813JMX8_POLGL|nr:unnamed protein product [Polarella glacialis]